MSKKAINVGSLLRANETYQPVIQALPFVALQEMAQALNMNILFVDKEDVLVNRRRAAGVMRPYFPGCTDDQKQELLKFVEMRLRTEKVFSDIRDNVTNYEDKKILSNAGALVDNKSKKHPIEFEMIKANVQSFGEDVCLAVWFGERDTEGKTPLAGFNGIFTVLDLLKTAGHISAEEGNLKTTGAITMPADGTSTAAYDTLVSFIRSANPFLRKGRVQLTCAQNVISAAKAAYKNKTKAFQDPTYDQFLAALRDASETPGLEICTHEAIGTGSKLILHKVGLLDVGREPGKGHDFCQIRNIGNDPNEVQFWIQDGFGTRVRDVHKKVFLTNEQTNTAPDLYGDYTPAADESEASLLEEDAE